MFVHPQLDTVDEIIRVVSWPTLFSALVWVVKKWNKGQTEFKEMSENTKVAVAGVREVKAQVDVIQNNHLVHLQEGIIRLVESNDKAVDALQNIAKDTAVLVDRDRRV